MRPRHKAAENRVQKKVLDRLTKLASMRPRHKAAENPDVRGTSPSEPALLQ